MDFITAIQNLTDPLLIILMLMGIFIGVFVGALPGLSGPMALGILIPVTFGMSPIHAILFLLGIHFGATYAGSIMAILINTPGTVAGAAAALDGYPLTQKGESRKALQMSAVSIFVGGTISVLSLFLVAPQIAKIALNFGPTEFFALGLFGMSMVASAAGKQLYKALFSTSLGVLITLIGRDPVTGITRFTFGIKSLEDGIPLVAALIGLFAIPEIIKKFATPSSDSTTKTHVSKLSLKLKEVKQSFKTMVKGGGIGVLVGSLPGTGAAIASFLSYNEEVRSSKEPNKYGKGELNGVAAAESGSAGVESAALIPLLTLGIPGDVPTAIILGAMILHGIQVGPQLFVESGDLVSTLFLGIILLTLFVFLIGWFGSRYLVQVIAIPQKYLFSVIIVLVFAGAFSTEDSIFPAFVVMIFGVLGYILQRFDFSIPPLLLGLVLGPIVEENFMRAIASSGGDYSVFFTRPITVGIFVLTLIFMFLLVRMNKKNKI